MSARFLFVLLALAGCRPDREAPAAAPAMPTLPAGVPEGVPPYRKPLVLPDAFAAPIPIRDSSPVSGRLTAETDTLEGGEHADAYSVSVRAGQTLVARMTSEVLLDPYVVLTSPGGEQVETNSSRVGGADWRVETVAREDGTWRIVATTIGRATTGPYELSVTVSSP